jgi:hypothetical protein
VEGTLPSSLNQGWLLKYKCLLSFSDKISAVENSTRSFCQVRTLNRVVLGNESCAWLLPHAGPSFTEQPVLSPYATHNLLSYLSTSFFFLYFYAVVCSGFMASNRLVWNVCRPHLQDQEQAKKEIRSWIVLNNCRTSMALLLRDKKRSRAWVKEGLWVHDDNRW